MLALRTLLVGLTLLSLTPSAGAAQEWARKMFDSTTHSFGPVARGAKAEHTFVITNIYEEDVHISGIRSSCGCTTPQLSKDTLKTFETTDLVAQFNTRAFQGEKNSTLTVTFDQPFFAEVQIQISGYIRTDVVLNPGSVDFGSVDHGAAAERSVAVSYAGRNDWQILDVRSASPYLRADVLETGRGQGQVSYNLVVRLLDDAPVGYINEQLTVVTNDARATQFPVDVQGRVQSDITVSPASLFMGVLQPGQEAKKQLVIRGREPFRITGVTCDNENFKFETSDAAKPLHLVPVTFMAGNEAGKVTQKVHIETDLGEDLVPDFYIYAQVVEP